MGVSNVLLLYWIRLFGKALKQKLSDVAVEGSLDNVEIIEMDELHSYCKKNARRFGSGLLLICTQGKIVDLELGSRGGETYHCLVSRLKKKCRVNYLCTDNYAVYQ